MSLAMPGGCHSRWEQTQFDPGSHCSSPLTTSISAHRGSPTSSVLVGSESTSGFIANENDCDRVSETPHMEQKRHQRPRALVELHLKPLGLEIPCATAVPTGELLFVDNKSRTQERPVTGNHFPQSFQLIKKCYKRILDCSEWFALLSTIRFFHTHF